MTLLAAFTPGRALARPPQPASPAVRLVAAPVAPSPPIPARQAVPLWELRFSDDALTYSRSGVGLRPDSTGLRLDVYG